MQKKQFLSTIFSTFMVVIAAIASEFACFYGFAEKTTALIINAAIVFVLAFVYILLRIQNCNNIVCKIISFSIWSYLFVLVLFALMRKYNILTIYASVSKLKELILSTGAKGVIVFIAVQIAQVIISPIPGVATVVVGAQIFGPFLGFLYSSIGIIIGSMIAFSIGKLFGKKLTSWLAGEDDTIKYRKLLEKKGKFLLPFIFLFPFFPDDIICIIAGITTMSYGYFILIVLITRPIGILISSYISSGKIIPFHGSYLIIWILLISVVVLLMFLIYKNSEKIEYWLTKKYKSKKKQS